MAGSDTGAGGGRPDLASSPAEKTAAANKLQSEIGPRTEAAGQWADEETHAAVKAFDAKDGYGWLTSGALKKAHATWGEQVKNLLNRLAGDESALRDNAKALSGTDLLVGGTARQVSVFDTYTPPTGG
ncbi:hypothetical protein [Streptomyces rubradiris]|uniref:Excreted virulence factor EspC, type VII ESX diderm n=1 Tax=Streptomyces rubradiris TaxID=285531 RepID=A0ABQ3RJ91_STRRR|nr:hypothetical protein [Streptomyces rubradiris]GHH08243.1 hypothetical protein GCM10018792_29730 [Streptomyces rubradiris]GHI55942.1 hypothetical protein Srubr_57880 [Streptomyces rubradiris]